MTVTPHLIDVPFAMTKTVMGLAVQEKWGWLGIMDIVVSEWLMTATLEVVFLCSYIVLLTSLELILYCFCRSES